MTTATGPGRTAAGVLEDLLRRFRERGEPEALAELFDRTAPALFRVAIGIAPDAAAAEDAVQETFLALLADPSRPSLDEPLMPWLATVLRNKMVDARRRARRVPDPLRIEPRLIEPAPADAVERREATDRVRAALARLDEPYRSVALLRWEYGLEPGEIAHARHEAPGTVRSLLSRALQKLRADLGGTAALAIVLGVRPPQGLVAIRANVLAKAGVAVPAGLAVAGIAVSAKAALLVLAGTLALGLAAGLVTGAAMSASRRGGDAEVARVSSPADVPGLSSDSASPRSSGGGVRARGNGATPRAIDDPGDPDEPGDPGEPVSDETQEPAAAPAGPSSGDVRAEAERILDSIRNTWRTGHDAGRTLARLRPAEPVLAAVRERWASLPPVGRQNLAKGFAFAGTSPIGLDVLEIAAADADPRVRDFALHYMEPYAGRRFDGDRAAAAAWRDATRAESPETLLDRAFERVAASARGGDDRTQEDAADLLADIVRRRASPALRSAALALTAERLSAAARDGDPSGWIALAAASSAPPEWLAAQFESLHASGGAARRAAFLLAASAQVPVAAGTIAEALRSGDAGVEDAAAALVAARDDRRHTGEIVAALARRAPESDIRGLIAALEDLTLTESMRGRTPAEWAAWWRRVGPEYDAYFGREEAR